MEERPLEELLWLICGGLRLLVAVHFVCAWFVHVPLVLLVFRYNIATKMWSMWWNKATTSISSVGCSSAVYPGARTTFGMASDGNNDIWSVFVCLRALEVFLCLRRLFGGNNGTNARVDLWKFSVSAQVCLCSVIVII